jgi:dipeptidyl aminopeptidase/acylaminoacyl peptidase
VTHHATRSAIRFRVATVALTVALALSFVYAQAPAKKILTIDDYTRWRNIAGQEISGDGNWVSYDVQLTNAAPTAVKPILHLLNLGTNQDVEIANGSGGKFSADSRWIAYQVDPSGGRGGRGGRGGGTPAADTPSGNGDGLMSGGEENGGESLEIGQAAPGGQQPAPGGGQGAQAGRGGTPPTPPTRVELRNLATGAVQSWQEIESFTFSANSTHLFLRRRPAARAGATGGRGATTGEPGSPGTPGGAAPAGAAAAAAPTEPRGVDVILHNLATGRDQLLGSVGDIAFNKAGDLLAYTVDATAKDANGLFVLDLRNGRLTTLDNAARNYNRLTWSEDGTALAVLKGADVEKMRERDNVLIAFPNVQSALDGSVAPVTLDTAKAAGFPKGWVVSDRAALSWSDDKKRVFFGIKQQVAAPDTSRRRNADEVADVDVWNTIDERIQSMQMIRAEQDRNFTFRQAFDVSAGRFVPLADATMRDLDVAQDGRWAVGRDTRGYISDYKRAAADIYRVNTTTGERTLMLKNQMINTSTGSHTFGISPDGHYFLYWKDNRYQAYDLDAGTTQTLAGVGNPVSFVDMEFDHPGPRPSYGIAGYTTDGKSVIVNHRYDLWLLPLDGSAPRNLTNQVGSKSEIRFRYVRTEPLDQAGPGIPGAPGAPGGGRGGQATREKIDLSKPITLSAYGEYTKKAGFYELAGGQMKELVYEDASFSTPVKAAKADKYLFTRQTFSEFPDLRVSGPGFKDSKKISNVNPQQAEYLWGHRILFDFKNKDGIRLQGILALPDDYKPGEKRPMLVNFYEKNSQNLHRYTAPTYLTSMGSSPVQAVSEGYITMIPDIYFHTGPSHSDMLECVEAAVKKVIEMGYVDPKRIGINGHSYGGEGAAFIGTRSKLFAAVAEGAGVTDLYNDFNQNWGWSYQVTGGSGANGHDYYLYSQGREAVAPWDKPEMYRFESALAHVPEVTAPILIMHGTADPTVSFTNSLGFYNALRYNRKNAILLAYTGEGHGLRGLANRRDLTIRYFQFFDHYLKGAPAPTWMTEGVPFLEKDANRDPRIAKRAAATTPSSPRR